ncbi:hypothetical protein [Streptomyces sp. NBC_00572]|uniref:hypothetical protein n=1 Tax=Streptomyces sp. NBC_00572 TaxID=2903664 RepID=UPI00224D3D66|nr:hypothetical protein [Streptomyces sp. NBC_00572]MCX4987029.1 hypothetical protein [Streptomyces sp. NBC_00572]
MGRREDPVVGGGTVTLADGHEVLVVAALVLKVDPDMVPGFTYDRHTSWAGSIHTDTADELQARYRVRWIPD